MNDLSKLSMLCREVSRLTAAVADRDAQIERLTRERDAALTGQAAMADALQKAHMSLFHQGYQDSQPFMREITTALAKLPARAKAMVAVVEAAKAVYRITYSTRPDYPVYEGFDALQSVLRQLWEAQ